jgi:hypothetical protein
VGDKPQTIFSADPSDSWNRIFRLLFTRTVRARLSEEFAGSSPLERVQVMGFPELPVTVETFERIESGDRAIEPLDPFPVHIGSNGSPQRPLEEPSFTLLKQALTDLVREKPGRAPIARAVMQSDLWAAHDVLFSTRPRAQDQRQRRDELLTLLARSIRKLSLSRQEIEALPDNYAAAHLPFDLFARNGPWIETGFLPNRLHDSSADDRRVARIFLKPSSPPADRGAWLNKLRQERGQTSAQLEAVALVVQLLLVDTEAKVIPTTLTYEVQLRKFRGRNGAALPSTEVAVAELSRKALLLDGHPGGLRRIDEREPAYLPSAGNDYFFASAHAGSRVREATILTTLRKRCQSCHGEGLTTVLTFAVHEPEPPPVRELNVFDNAHAEYVSRRKMKRTDFAELKRRWDH